MSSERRRRVSIINSAQTVLKERWSDRQHVDLISEAVARAVKGTGIGFDDIDFVIDSGSDFLDGRSISNCGFLGSMGAHFKEESRVEDDGLWALTYAANKIASGSASIGLVIAYSKPSEGDIDAYWTNLLEPFMQRPTGLDHLAAAGLYGQRYLHAAGLTADDLRAVSERAWERAALNAAVDVDVPGSDDPFWRDDVASPLRQSDLARPVDGAVALLVTSAEVAAHAKTAPVWITGMGSAIDQHFLAAREPDTLPACEAAAKSAYRMAGDLEPGELDLVEISASSTVGELMVLEAIGYADRHAGIKKYRDAPESINPSGGALPADPIMATGLVRAHEVAARLAGRIGFEQASGPRGLAHGTGGFGMQNHCVVTMEVDS